jgi:hypothetical protein
MKNSAKMALLFLALIPSLYGCYGNIEGSAKKINPASGQCDLAGDYMRVKVNTGETGCSGTDGVYTILQVLAGVNKTVTYRKSGYATQTKTVTVQNNQTAQIPEFCLDFDDPETSIRGTVSWDEQYNEPKNIAVSLYELVASCGGTTETLRDTVLTCEDGKYSFPNLTGNNVTYRVKASFTGCTFSPAAHDVVIPQADGDAVYNFSGCQ